MAIDPVEEHLGIPRLGKVPDDIRGSVPTAGNGKDILNHQRWQISCSFQPAFYFMGVDCFGPYSIQIDRRNEKRWGILFKCLTICAVHIDLLTSLDNDAFIMSLRRFIPRRGKPYDLLCDQLQRRGKGTGSSIQHSPARASRETCQPADPVFLYPSQITTLGKLLGERDPVTESFSSGYHWSPISDQWGVTHCLNWDWRNPKFKAFGLYFFRRGWPRPLHPEPSPHWAAGLISTPDCLRQPRNPDLFSTAIRTIQPLLFFKLYSKYRRIQVCQWEGYWAQSEVKHSHTQRLHHTALLFLAPQSVSVKQKEKAHPATENNNQNITTGPLSFRTDLKFLSFTLGRGFSGHLR